LNDLFGVVSTRERPFRVSPVGFGLAPVAARNGPSAPGGIAQLAWGFGRTLLNPEVLQVVNLIGLVVHADDKGVIVFSICETGQTKQTGNVGSRSVTTEL
jgi:hypothetical protein